MSLYRCWIPVASDHQNYPSACPPHPFRVVPTRTFRTLFQSFFWHVRKRTPFRVSFQLTSSPCLLSSHNLDSNFLSHFHYVPSPRVLHIPTFFVIKISSLWDKNLFVTLSRSFLALCVSSLLTLCSRFLPILKFLNLLTSSFQLAAHLVTPSLLFWTLFKSFYFHFVHFLVKFLFNPSFDFFFSLRGSARLQNFSLCSKLLRTARSRVSFPQ